MLVRALAALALLSPFGSPLASQTPAGALIVHNERFDSVRVEVSLGSSSDCALNPSVGAHTLRRGQRWAVVSGRVICWRRETVPGNAAEGWTDWAAVQVAPATKREVAL